jgi:DNA-binding response OmpR family regulator
MPMINGKEVLKEIRVMERYKNTPGVLFSTSSHHFERKFAEDYNAAFISKPMDMGELEEIINQFIDRCSSDIQWKP